MTTKKEATTMTERTSYDHGTPSWTDLSSSDPEAAKAYYGSLFGWSFEDKPAGDGVYMMALKNGKNVAALMHQQPDQAAMGIPSMWNTYVSVDDLEATVAKVVGAGGTIMAPPMDVMTAGKMAVIVDPTGAVSCLWQAGDTIGAEIVNEPGTLCWNELTTPDVPAAAAFYSELYGWGTQTMDMGDDTYTVFTLGEDGIAGSPGMPVEGMPPCWTTVFAVQDCDKAVADSSQLGGSTAVEPFDTPIGRIAVLADPTGAIFQIISLNEQAE